MKNHLRKLSLLIALIGASITFVHAEGVVSPLPPVALPEAMTSAQMKAWKAELAAKNANPAATASTPGTFYTGKPYIAETGGYAFKYREYNPEMSRWTTVDPSGFPDGVNASTYCKNSPVNGFDWQGNQYVVVEDDITSVKNYTFNEYSAATAAIGSVAAVKSGNAWAIGFASAADAALAITIYKTESGYTLDQIILGEVDDDAVLVSITNSIPSITKNLSSTGADNNTGLLTITLKYNIYYNYE